MRTSDGYTLYALIFKLPGMNSMRVMNRFMHVELFFILALSILVIRKLPIKWSPFFFLLIFLDNSFVPSRVIREEKVEIQARRIHLKKEINALQANDYIAFAVIDSKSKPYETHIDAMLVSLEINFPTINAYTSSCPDDFGKFFNENNQKGLELWLTANSINKDSILIFEK